MDLKFYSPKKLKKEIYKIVSSYLNMKEHKVFFFGSRVKGDNFSRSDIDIGIEGPRKIPSEKMMKIKEEIDNLPTLYTFDIVDFKNITNDFKKEALKNIEYVK